MILLIIGLVIWVYILSERIEDVRKRVDQLTGKAPAADAPRATATPAHIPRTPFEMAAAAEAYKGVESPQSLEVPRETPRAPVLEQRESGLERGLRWLKQDFMVKLGAFLLLLALGWFVSYAFANDWIDEMGRITLGVLTGVAFMVLGVWRIQTHVHQGGIFTVLGSTTVYLTLWAARGLYDMFTPMSVLALMGLTAAFVAFVSVRYSSNSLALAGLILAGVAPFLTFSPTPDIAERFTYLLVIVLGTLWVVYLRGWSNLTFTALVLVFLYGIPFISGLYDEGSRDIALMFAFIFTTIFFIANILGLIANESKENANYHLAIALSTGFYLIVWIAAAASPEWQSLLYVMWMLVFSLGSFVVYRVLENRIPFYIYGATSIALLAAATAAELHGPALTIAFTIEVALLVGLAARLFGNVRIANKLATLFVVPVLLSLGSIYASAWYEGVMHDDFFVLFILGSVLALVGFVLIEMARVQNTSSRVGSVLIGTAALYGLALIWLVLHAGTQQIVPSFYYSTEYGYSYTTSSAYQLATMYSLVIYTLLGLIAYIRGVRDGHVVIKRAGAVLLGFVVLRLLFVEVWQMDLVWRIVTFMVIGSLLVSTAFIRRTRHSTSVPHAEGGNN